MIRPPVAADKYYSAEPDVLLDQVAECFRSPAPLLSTAPRQGCAESGLLQGIIVPHGSMQDSGKVAAVAYSLLFKALQQRILRRPLRVILLGTNHFILQPAACLSRAAAWATPLGEVPLDVELNKELHEARLPYDDRPHSVEHSVENQLPFLQHVTALSAAVAPGGMPHAQASAGFTGFTMAPISIGWLSATEEVDRIADVLAAVISRHSGVVLIATSDFTHAGPSYSEAPAAPWMTLREHAIWRDSPLLHAITSGPHEAFMQACSTAGTSLCGRWPVAVFMRVAQVLEWDLELLSYAPSDLYVRSGNVNGFAAFAALKSS